MVNFYDWYKKEKGFENSEIFTLVYIFQDIYCRKLLNLPKDYRKQIKSIR